MIWCPRHPSRPKENFEEEEKIDIFGAQKVDLARSDWDLMSYVSVIPKLIKVLSILAAISLAHEWNFPVFLLIFICIFIYKGRSCLCIYLYSHNSRHTEISTQLGQNSRYKSGKSCRILNFNSKEQRKPELKLNWELWIGVKGKNQYFNFNQYFNPTVAVWMKWKSWGKQKFKVKQKGDTIKVWTEYVNFKSYVLTKLEKLPNWMDIVRW